MNITIGGHIVELVADGAIWLAEFGALAVADLHFEKGSSFSRFSTFLPPYDSGETLGRLGALIERYRPKIFIAAGDSFHDQGAADRLRAEDRQALNALIATVSEWYWLAGNHDPKAHAGICGLWREEFSLSDIAFRHQLTTTPGIEISGHYHPKARIALNGHRMSMPCFVQTGTCLILPSFGQYTGGLDIDNADFTALAPRETRQIFAIYQDRIFQL